MSLKQDFFIPCILPNMNDIIEAAKKGRRGYQPYALMKAEYELLIRACIKKAKIKTVVGPVELALCWREKHQRRDLDGITAGLKFICDALVQTGILNGDGWKQIRGLHHDFCVNPKAPGVYVTIIPCYRGETIEPV